MNKTEWITLACLAFYITSCSDTGNKGISGEKKFEVENGYSPSKQADLLPVKNYVQWVQNTGNGFRKEKTIKDLTFSAQFKPYEYIVCLEEKRHELADSIVRKRVSELKDMQYYELRISSNKAGGELLKRELSSAQQYQERVNYFAFGMQRDIQLVEGTDTLPCVMYHFERSFDVSPESVFLLGFPIRNGETQEDKTLLVYDRTFNTGLIKFTFSKKALKNLPKLKTI